MRHEKNTQPASASVHRPWIRLHHSTWVVTALFAVLGANVVFVGDERELTGDIDHGWPFIFVEWHEESLVFAEERQPLRLWFGIWNGHVDNFNTLALLADLGVLVSGILILAAATEWRRRRRRGFWQVSLRDVLAWMFVIAAVFAWFGSAYRSTSQQRQIVENLNRLDQAANGGRSIPFPSFSADWDVKGDWIFEPLGLTGETKPLWWADVVTVYVWGDRVDAASVAKQLEALPDLSELILQEVPITDAALKRISRMRKLRFLSLSGTGISDSQIRYLASLKDLKGLELSYNDISDEGLAHLHGLNKLEYLDIVNNSTTDEGVARLQRAIPGLKVSDD